MAISSEKKETRLVARVSEEIQQIIQRAADYSGATVSQFLIDSAMERARNVIEKTETLHVSKEAAEAIFIALEEPPEANKKLLQAVHRYRDTVNANNH